MKKLIKAVLIGAGAGVIDVAPMAAQKMNVYACLSAFVFWLAMGIVISYVVMPVRNWLKGLIVAELSMLPIGVLIFQSEPGSVVIVVVMTALLGSLTGYLTGRYAA